MDNRPWKGRCRCGRRIIFHIRGGGVWYSHPDGTAPCINFGAISFGKPITRALTRRPKYPMPSPPA